MRYSKIDAQMARTWAPQTRYTGCRSEEASALASFLAARRAAKPRVRYLDRLGVWQVHHKGYATLGLTIEGACRCWFASWGEK